MTDIHWWQWLLFALISVVSAIFYRMGGSGKFNTKARDIGCMLCVVASMLILGVKGQWWMYFLSSGAMFGCLTTYHKWLNPLFGKDKEDVYWWGWFAHGLCFGLALLFFYPIWKAVLLRSFALGLAIMLWSENNDDAVFEECGRGFLINASVPLLLIFN
jgi:hypothetical protein